MELCPVCRASLEGKRSIATFCNEACKQAAYRRRRGARPAPKGGLTDKRTKVLLYLLNRLATWDRAAIARVKVLADCGLSRTVIRGLERAGLVVGVEVEEGGKNLYLTKK